jgi:nitrite reductase (NADH) small subunit
MSEIDNNWRDICPVDAIVPNAGRCALVDGKQVAIFRISRGDSEEVYAIENHDPFSQTNVLSRGLVGSIDERIVVASPIYKQHFCLKTGSCLEQDETQLKTYPVRIENNRVQLSA